MQNPRLAVLLIAVFIPLSGCTSPQRAPTAEQLMLDDKYTTRVVLADKSVMEWEGLVSVETDADGTVHFYGKAYDNGRKPNLKVSGKGKFVVHSAGNVKVDDGATIEAHDCDLIKAGERTTVRAYQCRTVRALTTAANIEPHGNTVVERIEAQVIQPEARIEAK